MSSTRLDPKLVVLLLSTALNLLGGFGVIPPIYVSQSAIPCQDAE
jgi:hypothetical protein